MQPDAIDVAIAEYCGWSEITPQDSGKRRYGVRPNSFGEKYQIEMIPQFHACLNAMHKAETVLTYEQFDEYYIQLSTKMVRPFHSTAAQRSEAFLRTIGKWQEPDKLLTHIAV